MNSVFCGVDTCFKSFKKPNTFKARYHLSIGVGSIFCRPNVYKTTNEKGYLEGHGVQLSIFIQPSKTMQPVFKLKLRPQIEINVQIQKKREIDQNVAQVHDF